MQIVPRSRDMLKKGGLTDHLKSSPSMPELHQLLGQALEKRGKHLQVSWRGRQMIRFVLDVICKLKGGEPSWSLYCDRNNKLELLFEYTSCDVLLVFNIMMSACENSPDADDSKAVANQFVFRDSNKQQAAPTAPIIPSANSEPSIDFSVEQSGPVEHAQAVTQTRVPAQAITQTRAPAQRLVERTELQAKSVSREPGNGVPDSGDLREYPIADLIQAVTAKKVTGKLEVTSDQALAIVYVQDGLPIDATAGELVGDDAMIELLTWRSGQFTVESRVLRNGHTVHQSIESLLEQSKQLSDCLGYLKEIGMLPTSTLRQKDPDLSKADFVDRTSHGAPVDMDTLAGFYRGLDGSMSIGELTRSLPISRVKLIYIIHHLVIFDVIQICNDATTAESLILQPRPIDTAAIQTVMMSLRRADTGMFMYPAFLYFLEQEYFRSYRAKSWFSVAVFEMKMITVVDGEVKRRPLPLDSVVDAVLKISSLKRHVDLLAHYDGLDYALLLPNTRAAGSRIFGNRIVKALQDSPLAGLAPQRLSLSFGCASVPEDFTDLSSLLGACDLAMSHARETKQSIVLYRDIKNLTAEPERAV